MKRLALLCLLLVSAALAGPAHAAAGSSPARSVPFIEDDYARALREARARHVPIFVESWAPW